MSNDSTKPKISIIVPFFNEEENVEEMYARLKEVMGRVGEPYELIFVDDGSADRTYSLLKEIYRRDERVIVLKLRRNFGQTPALQAGFDRARGEIIVSMDGDLQHDPAEIPQFLAKIAEGYDIVSGWRKDRKDNALLRKLPSWVANRMMKKLVKVKIHDFGTTYKAYRREVVQTIHLYGELHRFIPALISREGFKITEIPISNIVRQRGKSNYGLSRVRRVFFDLMTVKFLVSFLDRPLQFFGLIGLAMGGTGFGIALVLTIGYYAASWPIKENIGWLLLAVLLMIIGSLFIMTGLLAEVISRIYYVTHGQKIYNLERVDARTEPEPGLER
ncbi:MAG: glycosyltransferase family 2 protein [Acidobacteriota bacterium]|nr:glycosyltransferase family 2 protein [Acidobacteriota bacterium]